MSIFQALYTSNQHFLDVPKLPDSDVSGILDKWLEIGGRKLTDVQRQKVMDAFQKCPLPLFLKLSFDQACRWTSYSRPDLTVLQDTVRGSIDALLARVEQLHGKLFVSRALTYLTLSTLSIDVCVPRSHLPHSQYVEYSCLCPALSPTSLSVRWV